MNWFTPKCPVVDDEKQWIENSALWIQHAFDLSSFNDVQVILPTPEFFPDTYRGDEQHVKKLFDRVCSYMNVDPNRIELELVMDEENELHKHLPVYRSSGDSAAGVYHNTGERMCISLSSSNLNDPMTLVATIAHELGHVLLLGDNRITHERKDHEHLTDLLTVFLGLGIFTANSAFRFTGYSGGGKQGWKANRLGYLSEQMFGYALAYFAWLRKEKKPSWAKHLEGNPKHYFKSGLKFLAKREDA